MELRNCILFSPAHPYTMLNPNAQCCGVHYWYQEDLSMVDSVGSARYHQSAPQDCKTGAHYERLGCSTLWCNGDHAGASEVPLPWQAFERLPLLNSMRRSVPCKVSGQRYKRATSRILKC